MKEYIITDKKHVGLRLEQYLHSQLPYIPYSLINKIIRKKEVKINGVRAHHGYKLLLNEQIQIFINDKTIEELKKQYYRSSNEFRILYEDENIILVDKKQGVLCHEDENGKSQTLISSVHDYIVNTVSNIQYLPELCNRIDRNTGGIVIIAKNPVSKKILDEKIKDHEIQKYYLCVVEGIFDKKNGRIENQIFKDSVKKISYIVEKKEKKTRTAITEYRVLACNKNISLLECKLITGRMHQIRAQLANMGHSIIGDLKYGNKILNKTYGEKKQLLYSYKLEFNFTTDAGKLNYLKSKSFTLPNIRFLEKYFSEIELKKLFEYCLL